MDRLEVDIGRLWGIDVVQIKSENCIKLFKYIAGDKKFSRKNNISCFKNRYPATNTRNLREVIEKSILEKTCWGLFLNIEDRLTNLFLLSPNYTKS